PDARPRHALRRPRQQRGREVRRRRAARRPDQAHDRKARRRSRRSRGPDQTRARKALDPTRGSGRGGRGAVARRPLTFRRLVGLDRSGGPPPETLSGRPLHPWTIPNAIGFTRLALLPVFLIVALRSKDGHSTAAF